jgi:hypothetical protein
MTRRVENSSPAWHISPTSSPESLADWLELQALFGPARTSSLQDLVTYFKTSGSIEEVTTADDPFDSGSERAEQVAEAAMDSLASRQATTKRRYPFSLTSQSLSVKRDGRSSVYAFLLLLSTYGPNAGPREDKGAELFELIAGNAMREYLGYSANGARAFQFGFPRRIEPSGFKDALNKLCLQMNEGHGSRDQPTRRDQKDAKLDVVAWIPMPDTRGGKLMAFGQCATGWNWRDKLSDLQAQVWCEHWMLSAPPVLPIKAFLMPHAPIDGDWTLDSRYGGIVFDRPRICHFSQRLPTSVKTRAAAWSTFVLDHEQAP